MGCARRSRCGSAAGALGRRTMMSSGSWFSLDRAKPSVSLGVGMLMLNRGPAMATSGAKPSPRHVRDGEGVHSSCS